MATGATTETNTLLFDDFSAPLVSSTWAFPVGNPSFYGRTQIRPSLPNTSNGNLHLTLDTFNPSSRVPGDSFFGSEAFTNQTFSTSSGGVAFEVSARFVTPVSGGVFGFFGFQFTGLDNEIDFESLGNDAASGVHREETNVYANEPLGAGHGRFVPDGDLTSFHAYRIEWFPDRVRWLIDNHLVREETAHIPQGSLALHLNFWAPASDWSDAYSAALQPVSRQTANTTYSVDVDYARVTRLGSELPSVATAAFNGDGISDILWQRTDGTLMIFDINANQLTNSPLAGQIGLEWHLLGVGDVNQDRFSDAVWERADGSLSICDFRANQVVGTPTLGHIGLEWQSLGVGDFNGDAGSDLLWQRSDGSLMVYLVANNQVTSSQVIGQIGTEWHGLGIGDFNGDGSSDVLWQRSDGTLMVFDIAKGQVAGTPIVGHIGSEWKYLSIGDFNGDGTSDILWQRSDGALIVFDLKSNQVTSTPIAGQIGTEWHFFGIGDFNSDGTSDILFRRDDGVTQIDDVVGNQISSAPILGNVGLEWRVLA